MRRSWLLPAPDLVASLPKKRVRTVGAPERTQRSAARRARWLKSAKGRAWLARNRLRRNAYHLARYHADPARREYLNDKQREYRGSQP